MSAAPIPSGARRLRQGGFVMVSVLTVLVLLTGLMAAVLMLSRGSGSAAMATSRALTLLALRQAGAELAGYELFVRQVPTSVVDGQLIRFDAGTITLTAESTAVRVDLNSSDPLLIAAAFKASGAKSMTPEAFAARVVDWRDADDDAGKGGAESADYAAAGATWSPANDVFYSVDDLRWILGLTSQDRVRLTPYFTVDNPSGKIDILEAPASMLAIVPRLTPATVKRILQLRQTPSEDNINALNEIVAAFGGGGAGQAPQGQPSPGQPPGSSGGMLENGGTQAYRVTLEIRLNDGSPPIKRAMVIIRGGASGRPYLVVSTAERTKD